MTAHNDDQLEDIRRLAAVTDTELADEIRTAVAEVLAALLPVNPVRPRFVRTLGVPWRMAPLVR